MIWINYCRISKTEHFSLLDRFLANYPKSYQDKILKYRRWQDAQLSLLGRVLLFNKINQIGAFFEEKDIKYTSYNKPYFENADINFNISHSGNIVVCALTKINVLGVDIEEKKDIHINDFKDLMKPKEWNVIFNSKDKTETFYQYWTKKEAILKASGLGLSIPLNTFDVSNDSATIKDNKFLLKKVKIDKDYCCCIALNTISEFPTVEIEEIKISSLLEARPTHTY